MLLHQLNTMWEKEKRQANRYSTSPWKTQFLMKVWNLSLFSETHFSCKNIENWNFYIESEWIDLLLPTTGRRLLSSWNKLGSTYTKQMSHGWNRYADSWEKVWSTGYQDGQQNQNHCLSSPTQSQSVLAPHMTLKNHSLRLHLELCTNALLGWTLVQVQPPKKRKVKMISMNMTPCHLLRDCFLAILVGVLRQQPRWLRRKHNWRTKRNSRVEKDE